MGTSWAILILTVPYLAPLLSLKSRGTHVVQVRNYHNKAHHMQNQKQELRCGARGGSSGQSGVVDEEEDGPKGWKEGKAQHTGRGRGRERGIGAVSGLLFPFTALWWHLVKGLFFFFLNASRFVSPFSGVLILLPLSLFRGHGFSRSSLLLTPSLSKEIEEKNSTKFFF